MNKVEISNVRLFLQEGEETSFVSCSGVVDGRSVEFTVSDVNDLAPILTTKAVACKGSDTRFALERKATGGIVLVNPTVREVREVQFGEDVVQVDVLGYDRIELIAQPVAPGIVLRKVAARKLVPQSQAQG